MKKRTIRRAMALSVAMAALLALPMIAFAQASRNTHGGMFGTNSAQTENKGLMKSNGIVRSGTDENPFGNQAFGATDGGVNFEAFDEPYHEAPVGAGIAILLGAGLGYAAFKRRKNAKAKSTMLLAMAGMLLLGLAQCKKDGPEREMVEITLKFTADGQKGEASPNGFLGFVDIKEVDSLSVEGEKADDGQKGDIDPDNGNTAPVIYSEGDTMYVGSRGKYMGYLICQSNGTFTGMIDATAEEGAPLQFIYLGGRDVTKSLSLGETASFNFSLANQWDNLPVVSCGVSREEYDPGTSTYTSYLRNQCALVKFSSSPDYYRHLTLSGVKNKLVINFNGTVETTEETGDVDTHGKGFNRYIVVPADQGVVSGTASGRGALGTFEIRKAARPNGYIHGVDATIVLNPNPVQGEFTIDNAGTKVHFAPYNLTASTDNFGATWTWKFATLSDWVWNRGSYGYDFSDNLYFGYQVANQYINGNGTVSENGTVDLFGWSTPSTYYGINNSTDDGDYSGSFVDWGNVNIENGGGYNWFTLSREQWDYLIGHNTEGRHKLFVRLYGQYDFTFGLIRPDDDDWPTEYEYSAEGLALEAAAGSLVMYGRQMRSGVSYPSSFSYMGYATGFNPFSAFQTSSIASSMYYPEFCTFYEYFDRRVDDYGHGGDTYYACTPRCLGRSVRLVKDVNDPGGYPPTVITADNPNVGIFHLSVGGEVVDAGGLIVTQRGFCWSRSNPEPTIENNHIELGSGQGSFEATLSVEPGEHYFVRAYATNPKGTGYGDVLRLEPTWDYDLFSIGDGQYVKFAKGNLYWDYEDQEWSIVPQQWDYYTVSSGYWYTDRSTDLFSWGAWNHNTPYDTPNYNDYSTATGSDQSQFGNNDFTGLGDSYHWYVLSKEQWQYLINRTKAVLHYNGVEETMRLCGYGVVNGYRGIILLPDGWHGGVDDYFDDNFEWHGDIWSADDETYGVNYYRTDVPNNVGVTWNDMVEAGAIFLPAVGYGDYDGLNELKYQNGGLYYWTSTPCTSDNSPCDAPFIFRNEGHPSNVYDCRKKCAVRLVRNALVW